MRQNNLVFRPQDPPSKTAQYQVICQLLAVFRVLGLLKYINIEANDRAISKYDAYQ